MLEELVVEKMILVKNRFYTINKYLTWIIYGKDILEEYKKQEITKNKIYELMKFITLSKYQEDIKFIYNENFKILELEDDEYKVKFIIDNEFKIEYTILGSNINYIFNVDEQYDYSQNTNIIYTHVKYNINNVLNNKVYNLCKRYILK